MLNKILTNLRPSTGGVARSMPARFVHRLATAYFLGVLSCATIELLMAMAAASPAWATMAADQLRCEYLNHPVGIDETSPRLSWALRSDERGERQTAYQVLVASTPEFLAEDQGNLWDSGRVESDETIGIAYRGSPLRSHQWHYWKVRVWDKDGRPSDWSKPATWLSGLLDTSDWADARWIAADEAPSADQDHPALMLRCQFDVAKSIRRAIVSVTGLGIYELHINGHRVGNHLLAPEWTSYDRRIQYQTYDVSDLLTKGGNAVGAQLCGGWWRGLPVLMIKQPPAENSKDCLRMRLDVEYEDGTTQVVVSDSSWQATRNGPIRRSGIYSGEAYDATKEQPGWDQPDFDVTSWRPVKILPFPNNCEHAALVAQPNEPICVAKELQPIGMTEPKPGVYVLDMGQNMVGWCRLKASAPKGTRITLRHAELVNGDGTLYTDNLRGAAQKDEYVWRGGDAIVEPHFTYHGFRYVELTGLPSRPANDAVVGCVFHSAAPTAGVFKCSNELINKIMHCVDWVQRGNMMGVPTDCPQRDERLSWMGDIQAFAQTAIFNRDMAGFFSKCVRDIRDSQYDDGRFTNVAPHPASREWLATAKGEYGPGWSDAGVVIPWRVYVNYGDRRMLQEHFESARRWIHFVRDNNPDLIWRDKRGGDWGDWLNGDMAGAWAGLKLPGYPEGISQVPKDLFATAFFAHSTEIAAEMAKVLGHDDDAASYDRLFADIKAAFNKEFVASDGRIKGDTQAGYALAVHFGLVDDAMESNAIRHLREAIRRYNDHVSTGIQATHRMMVALSDHGCHEDTCRLINLRTVPSWGYMVDCGATTIWERWDCFVPGRGYQDPSMNSCNHWGLGSVGEWVWRELAGINPDEKHPGYKHFTVRPRPCADLEWVDARYDSVRGPITCNWRQKDGRFQMQIEVPANTTATVYIPTTKADTVLEGGKPASDVDGIEFVRMEGGAAVLEVPSGQYSFDAATGL